MLQLTPVLALVTLSVLGIIVVLLIALEDKDDRAGHVQIIVVAVAALIPSIIAAIRSDQAARSTRKTHEAIANGSLQEKARQGALQALDDAQVTTRTGPVAEAIAAELAAVRTLLEHDAAARNDAVGRPPRYPGGDEGGPP